jgi:D-3-phosphoglycerate dehydrogenase
MTKLLVVTPIEHIKGLGEKLRSAFDVTLFPDPVLSDLADALPEAEAIFTNPNKSRLPIDCALMDVATALRVIGTASTGLAHIDLEEASRREIDVVSLTRELATLERISSTAEHALALTLSALRRVPWGFADVLEGNWDYERFIGRQMDALTVGVVGYGRLGKMYARYADAIGSRVLVCDPAYSAERCPFPLMSIEELVPQCEIVSLHIHATPQNRDFFGERLLALAKPDLLLVNTSRGEVVDELALVRFLNANDEAKVATDVLRDELTHKWESPLIALAKAGGNVLITPHVGGMTREAQEIAYHRAADMLIEACGRGTGA